MFLRQLWLLPALALSALPLAEECPGEETPPPGDESHFPEGGYVFQSAYAFSFQDAPYVMRVFGQASGLDASAGDFTGRYQWAFWETQSAFEAAPNTPNCVLEENILGQNHPRGSVPGTTYAACTGCDPFSDVTFDFAQNQGCSQALFNYWYVDADTGEFLQTAPMVWGYRHAETDGWPTEFEGDSAAMEAQGFEGVLYDELVNLGFLGPNLYVAPASKAGRRDDEMAAPAVIPWVR